ncbi:MAG: hypothetical protein GY730_10025 [bacterium]|nr:hypothetical protein [bacterium]
MNKKNIQTIIYLADSSKDAPDLTTALEDRFEIDEIYDIKTSKDKLKIEPNPSLIIIDYHSFLEDTFDFICFMKDHYPRIAVIVVTGSGESEKDIAYCARALQSDGVIKGGAVDIHEINIIKDTIASI